MNRRYRINLFDGMAALLSNYDKTIIENSLVGYCLDTLGVASDEDIFAELRTAENKANADVKRIFASNNFPIDIETIVECFEYLIESDNRNENGIVFTPKYISDYIVRSIFSEREKWDASIKIVDPACGCGIFLVSAIEYVHKSFNVSIPEILQSNVYGIDMLPQNVRRCKTVLQLFCVMNGILNGDCAMHVREKNSLKTDWADFFGVSVFDYIVGNPPYVNTHDMTKETARFLKQNFETTKSGVYNIFYAFIEHGLKFLMPTGYIGFIVPNNFMTIKSAEALRQLIRKNGNLVRILDFADNMVFRPVRTYNCILTLSAQPRTEFEYCVVEKTDDVETLLSTLRFDRQDVKALEDNGWKLVDGDTLKNIRKIETQEVPLKEFVRTGIATLRDDVYFVDFDENGFYKYVDGNRFEIDSGIVKPIYKIPELKNCKNPHDVIRHIIFPYVKGGKGFALIEERIFRDQYANTYEYLLAMREVLDRRDKGKGNPYAWYAYGRTQGLNKYGRKLVFPTFAKNPNFIFVDDELSLFCNGYAVFENETFDLSLLFKILNSKVMAYYVRNTSYPIDGGYYCYQKKYIERFSLPCLSREERKQLMLGDQDFVDDFLVKKYALAI